MSELFERIDALVASRSPLPPPAERKRLRNAHGLTLDEVAEALAVRRATVSAWESGRTEPRPPERDAYARLLRQLAELYPAEAGTVAPVQDAVAPTTTTSAPAPAPEARPVPPDPAPEAADTTTGHNAPPSPAAPAAASRPARTTRPSPTSWRSGTGKATKAAKVTASTAADADPRFANGPLAVVDCEDGHVSAYCVGGLVLDVPAKSLPALVDWTLAEARLGQARLHRNGRDADPVLVLTPAALERYGLPVALSDDERRAGRLADSHKVVRQIKRADLQLTSAGSGRGPESFAIPTVPSDAVYNCASRPGTRWTHGNGTTRTTRGSRPCTPPTWPGTSARTRSW